MSESAFASDFVWQPDPAVVERSNLARFMRRAGAQSLADLIPRSLDDVIVFWDNVLTDLGIQFDKPYSQVADFSRGIEWPVWCVGGQMNITHNCLDKWIAAGRGDAIALRWEGEEGRGGFAAGRGSRAGNSHPDVCGAERRGVPRRQRVP